QDRQGDHRHSIAEVTAASRDFDSATRDAASMTSTAPTPTAAPPTADALVERLFTAANGTFLLYSTYLGERLGWYRALATRGPLDAAGLAAATHTDARYAHEWLEQQVATGILELD